jgi:hypothetical protein
MVGIEKVVWWGMKIFTVFPRDVQEFLHLADSSRICLAQCFPELEELCL